MILTFDEYEALKFELIHQTGWTGYEESVITDLIELDGKYYTARFAHYVWDSEPQNEVELVELSEDEAVAFLDQPEINFED